MCQATVYLNEEKIMEDVIWVAHIIRRAAKEMRRANGTLRLALDKLGPYIASRQEEKLERAGC